MTDQTLQEKYGFHKHQANLLQLMIDAAIDKNTIDETEKYFSGIINLMSPGECLKDITKLYALVNKTPKGLTKEQDMLMNYWVMEALSTTSIGDEQKVEEHFLGLVKGMTDEQCTTKLEKELT